MNKLEINHLNIFKQIFSFLVFFLRIFFLNSFRISSFPNIYIFKKWEFLVVLYVFPSGMSATTCNKSQLSKLFPLHNSFSETFAPNHRKCARLPAAVFIQRWKVVDCNFSAPWLALLAAQRRNSPPSGPSKASDVTNVSHICLSFPHPPSAAQVGP